MARPSRPMPNDRWSPIPASPNQVLSNEIKYPNPAANREDIFFDIKWLPKTSQAKESVMTSPAKFVALLNGQLDEMTNLIRRLVNIDSGSYDAHGVNRVQDVFAEQFLEAGFDVTRKPLPGF